MNLSQAKSLLESKLGLKASDGEVWVKLSLSDIQKEAFDRVNNYRQEEMNDFATAAVVYYLGPHTGHSVEVAKEEMSSKRNDRKGRKERRKAPNGFVRADSFARAVGYSNAHVYKMCRDGRLDSQKLGKYWFISASETSKFGLGDSPSVH